MDEQLQEDWLDRRLRDEMPYIDDAGFTARVVQKLPAPQRQRSFRALILITVTLLASGLTYLASDGGRFLVVAAYRFASMPLLDSASELSEASGPVRNATGCLGAAASSSARVG